MRCRQCEYSLWNVVGRTCPECGTPFNPAEYSFQPNMVRFCCPSCDQDYYGTSEVGLLVPPEFSCVRCGAHCSMATNMVLRPIPGAEGAEVDVSELPWVRRKSVGLMRAWWRTFTMCMGSPSKVGRAIRANQRLDFFSWGVSLILPLIAMGVLAGLLLVLLVVVVGQRGRSAGPSMSDLAPMFFMAAMVVFQGLLCLLLMVGAAAISWLIVKRKDPELRYNKVLACWFYGATPTVLMAIPCVSNCLLLALLGWIPALAGVMLSNVTRASGARVALSVIVPPMSLVALCGSGYALFLFMIFSYMPTPPPAFPPAPAPATQKGVSQNAGPDQDQDEGGDPDADEADGSLSPGMR